MQRTTGRQCRLGGGGRGGIAALMSVKLAHAFVVADVARVEQLGGVLRLDLLFDRLQFLSFVALVFFLHRLLLLLLLLLLMVVVVVVRSGS